jgi:hypothetical protein
MLLERLGAGGFGEVWRARDQVLQREVALKRIGLGPCDDGERAAREAFAAARLSHPAIVALYEACATGDAFYLVSELVEGATLAELIHADDLDDEEIVRIALALAAALRHAHSRGVIHRDIKPQNVLVPDHVRDEAEAAKLTDFGGASLAGEDALTRTGDIIGTLAYMAPEQSEGREAGEPADLYGLALVLYEAFAGFNPVRGATPAATARRIGRRLEPLERSRPDLPASLTRAIDTALAADPRRRGTLEELRRALAEERAPGAPPAPHRAQPPPRAVEAGVHPPVAERAERQLPAHALAVAPDPAAADAGDVEDAAPARLPHALPRSLWLGCGAALVAWEAIRGHPGVAVLVAAALVPLLALPRRAGPGWLVAAAAPALGTLSLAGAFPALAGQLRRWQARAALAALGYWWLALAEPLLARRLWLGSPSHTPPRAVWEGSLQDAALHVVGPLLTVGMLLGAALWALAAVVLPWLVRGRGAAVDIVAATMWSAAVVAAAPLVDSGLHAGSHELARGAVLGAVLGGALAVAARALRGPVRPHRA